jgi:hypothetical protein
MNGSQILLETENDYQADAKSAVLFAYDIGKVNLSQSLMAKTGSTPLETENDYQADAKSAVLFAYDIRTVNLS